jgi:hypothetical protein
MGALLFWRRACTQAKDFERVILARQALKQAESAPAQDSTALTHARGVSAEADALFISKHGHEQFIYRLSYLAVGQTPARRLRAVYQPLGH